MAQGYVYILKNPAHRENHFKIGMTTRTVIERIKELSSGSGVPQPFEEVYSILFDDCAGAEKQMHQLLAIYRKGKDREFFEVDLALVIKQLGELKIKELEDRNKILEAGLKEKIQELEKQQRLKIIADSENDISFFEGEEKYEEMFTHIQNLEKQNKEIIILEKDITLFNGDTLTKILGQIENLKSAFLSHSRNVKLQIFKIKMDKRAIELRTKYNV